MAIKIVILLAGVSGLWTLSQSAWVDRRLSGLIERALKRHTDLEIRDYASLMHLAGEYRIAEIAVEPEDWIAHRTLAESKLQEEGIALLGIQRPDGAYIGAPKGSREILPGDLLLLYSRVAALEQLDRRQKGRRGEQEHRRAVAEQKKVSEDEEQQESAPRKPTPPP